MRSHIRRTGAGLNRLLAVEDGGACGIKGGMKVVIAKNWAIRLTNLLILRNVALMTTIFLSIQKAWYLQNSSQEEWKNPQKLESITIPSKKLGRDELQRVVHFLPPGR